MNDLVLVGKNIIQRLPHHSSFLCDVINRGAFDAISRKHSNGRGRNLLFFTGHGPILDSVCIFVNRMHRHAPAWTITCAPMLPTSPVRCQKGRDT